MGAAGGDFSVRLPGFAGGADAACGIQGGNFVLPVFAEPGAFLAPVVFFLTENFSMYSFEAGTP